MINQIYKHHKTIEALQKGSLGPYVEEFLILLKQKGHPPSAIKQHCAIVGKLNKWLCQKKIDLKDFDYKQVDKFTQYQKQHTKRFLSNCYGASTNRIIAYLRHHGIIPNPPQSKIILSEAKQWVSDFKKYLQQERGLRSVTIERYGFESLKFLKNVYRNDPIQFEDLSVKHVIKYVQDHAHDYQPKTVKLMISALRSFLRFLKLQGEIKTDLSNGVLTLANWRQTHVPQFLTKTQVKLLLQSCNKKTVIGRRDYALLLLIVRFGLRPCEIVRLTLDDIDWDQGEIIIYGKGPRKNRYPLPHDVGKALVSYLKKGRPSCSTRSFFICSRAPLRGLARSSSVDKIVSNALKRADLNPSQKGVYLLRQTAAMRCLEKGATLPEVGELLRHNSIDTTAIYIKVDFKRLKAVSQAWPNVRMPGGAV